MIHPSLVSVPFTYASGVVLPLMGFWNAVIYTTTSWAAVKMLFSGAARMPLRGRSIPRIEIGGDVSKRRSRGSLSESTREFAREEQV